MKKLLILAAVAILTPGAIGCQCGPLRNWLCDGYEARCSQSCTPCMPECNPCPAQCAPSVNYGDMMSAPGIIPGPVGPVISQ